MSPAQAESNGGFPQPPAGLDVRELRVRHDGCGETTRLRIPATVPSRAVRRVVCQGCAHVLCDPWVSEAPDRRFAGERLWRYASYPIAAGAVAGALILIQGNGDEPASSKTPKASGASSPPAAAPAAAGARHRSEPGKARGKARGDNARLVREATFSLVLPQGWERTTAAAGATFAAAAADHSADATLWVDRDPSLDFPTFEARSLDQLRQLAGSAEIVDRVAAPTPEGTVVRLAAATPPHTPRYEVVLRAAGPYRYYLATTLQPDAPADVAKGVRLIQGSFLPEGVR